MSELREEFGISRYVQAGINDQLIEIDLKNPVFLAVALHKAKQIETLTLRESRMQHTTVIERDGQLFCNEAAIAFPKSRGRARFHAALPASRVSNAYCFDGFTPGSEWLSLKIYDEISILETVLVERLIPWVDDALERAAIDRWFFLRYRDTREHLRLHGEPDALLSALKELRECLVDIEFTIDSYEPETRRYGGSIGMQICESFFMSDSTLAGSTHR
jgi:lantibiotic biosynthesis protein